jgi:hypothetical protein
MVMTTQPNRTSPIRLSRANGLLVWHFLPDDGLTTHDEAIQVVAGQTLKMKPPIELCSRGYHGSVRAIDALDNAPGARISRCLLHGQVIQDTDKAVATHRTCLWVADATRTLHEFACWCAEQAMDTIRKGGQEPDARSLKAIEVKRAWLDGKATDDDLAAARDAAWDAARDAARDAAWDAAWDAARDAARTAAGDAALMARCLIVRDKLNPKHFAHALARMEVWRRGYCLRCDVNGKLFAYRIQPKQKEAS